MRCGLTSGKRLADELEVASAAVAGRADALDDPGACEHVEMVGEQVRLDADDRGEFGVGAVGEYECIDSRESVFVARRRVDSSTPGERDRSDR